MSNCLNLIKSLWFVSINCDFVFELFVNKIIGSNRNEGESSTLSRAFVIFEWLRIIMKISVHCNWSTKVKCPTGNISQWQMYYEVSVNRDGISLIPGYSINKLFIYIKIKKKKSPYYSRSFNWPFFPCISFATHQLHSIYQWHNDEKQRKKHPYIYC